jgi:Tn7-like transposition protein D/TniQ
MVNLSFFPKPYPDELFYSIIARYHYWSNNTNKMWTHDDLFGDRRIRIKVDFPSHINHLSSRLPNLKSFSSDAFINNHTLLPLYIPFVTSEKVEHASVMMKGKSSCSIGHFIGNNQSKIQRHNQFLICKNCLQEDLEKFNEAYWHRVHQVFGVFVCPKHHVPLFMTNLNKRTHEYYTVKDIDSLLEIKINNSDVGNHIQISKMVFQLLNERFPSLNAKDLKSRYLSHLQARGLANHNATIKENTLTKRIIDFYGAKYLIQLDCELESGNRNNWVLHLFRGRQNIHPLKHLLLINFLGLSLKEFFYNNPPQCLPFGEGPWYCLNPTCNMYKQRNIQNISVTRSTQNGNPVGHFTCNCGFSYSRRGPDKNRDDLFRIGRINSYGEIWEKELIRLRYQDNKTLKEISKELSVSILTISRKLKLNNPSDKTKPISKVEKNRQTSLAKDRWINLRKLHPNLNTTSLRKLLPSVYLYLYRNDHVWLRENSDKKKPSNKNLDAYWQKKDNHLSQKIDQAAFAIYKDKKVIQVTKTEIARRAGVSFNNLDKMPFTKNKLLKVIETKEDFQLRRVIRVINKMSSLGENITFSKVIKKASLQQASINLSLRTIKKIENIVNKHKN